MSAKKPAPKRKTIALNTRIAPEYVEALRAFAESKGKSIREVLENAIRYHVAEPPNIYDLPPLPPLPKLNAKPK